MSEKQNEELEVKEVETKEDISDEEIKENNRILRKVKKLAEKYNFKNGIDDIATYIKKEKELENTSSVPAEEKVEVVKEQPVEEQREEPKDTEHNNYHRFVANEKVWFIEFNSKHENKTFESIIDLYKFRPSQGTIKEVILNDIVRYRLKENHNIYEEDMICKTYDEALAKCDDMNK